MLGSFSFCYLPLIILSVYKAKNISGKLIDCPLFIFKFATILFGDGIRL
jgi:hypothetical protein